MSANGFSLDQSKILSFNNKLINMFVYFTGKSSNKTDDYPYSWSVPAYHPPTQQYKMAKVLVAITGIRCLVGENS